MSIYSTYAVCRNCRVVLMLKLDPTVLGCLVMKHFLLVVIKLLLLLLLIWIPVVHVLVLSESFLDVFLSLLLAFLIAILASGVLSPRRLRSHA